MSAKLQRCTSYIRKSKSCKGCKSSKTTHKRPGTGNTEGRLNKKQTGRDYIGINKWDEQKTKTEKGKRASRYIHAAGRCGASLEPPSCTGCYWNNLFDRVRRSPFVRHPEIPDQLLMCITHWQPNYAELIELHEASSNFSWLTFFKVWYKK